MSHISSPNQSQATASSSRGLKSSAFACNNCRKNKRKCDALKPSCQNCIKQRVECVYPVKRAARAVEDRLDQLERLMRDLIDEKQQSGSSTSRLDLGGLGEQDWQDEPFPLVAPQINLASISNGTPSSTRSVQSPRIRFLQKQKQPNDGVGVASSETRSTLMANATTQRDLEPVVLLMYSIGLPDAPHELYKYLLDYHWAWIQPLWSFVYRPAFVRGMSEQSGPYFSAFLFHAIMAHSTRFCRNHPAMAEYTRYVDYFFMKARIMVMDEIDKPSSVATVQGLLLLSAVENSKGRMSQSWTYSGMAFRMLQDLRIDRDEDNADQFTAEDLEARRRLGWSAYVWDKMISVYMGRLPALQKAPSTPPRLILDESSEYEYWSPMGSNTPLYVPQPGYGVSQFVATCRAAEVLNGVLLRTYRDPEEDAISPGGQGTEDADLMDDSLAILKGLKPNLRIKSGTVAPVHHIAGLNCLIHTVIILAHRPYFLEASIGPRDVVATCIESATTIIEIARSVFEAYGECKFNIFAYSIWNAASVFVLQLKAQRRSHNHSSFLDQTVATQLVLEAKHMLEVISVHCTGIQRITNILKEELRKLGISTPHTVDPVNSQDGLAWSLSSIPGLQNGTEVFPAESTSPLDDDGMADEGFLQSLFDAFLSN